MEEYANDYFNLYLNHDLYNFMTMTNHVTDKCKKQCPRIVHVDRTAKTQIVNKRSNPRVHKIIDEYRKFKQIHLS